VILAACLLALSAQETPVFRAGVALVPVDAAVLQDGRIVEGLRAEDFIVREDGVSRPILHFASEEAPLDLLLLLDVSGSMRLHVEALARTAREALAPLRDRDRLTIAVFTDRFSTVPSLDQVRIVPDAGTDVSGGILAAAAHLRKNRREASRRAVLLVTDNRCRRTRPDKQVIAALLEADAVLNAIAIPARFERFAVRGGRPEFVDLSKSAADIRRIAAQTGGEVVSSTDAFASIVDRIRRRYSLYYRPRPGRAGKFRAIAVDLAPEAKRRFPGARILARSGYIPAAATGD
jgi:VWFA-related protein